MEHGLTLCQRTGIRALSRFALAQPDRVEGSFELSEPAVWLPSLDSRAERVRLRPQGRGDGKGIDSGPGPPFGFITAAVDLTMVDTAKRDRELVARLAPKGRMLGKPEVVRVRRPAATDQARMFADKLDMRFVADPARLGPRQGTLIDCR
jgi:hypothetical protein